MRAKEDIYKGILENHKGKNRTILGSKISTTKSGNREKSHGNTADKENIGNQESYSSCMKSRLKNLIKLSSKDQSTTQPKSNSSSIKKIKKKSSSTSTSSSIGKKSISLRNSSLNQFDSNHPTPKSLSSSQTPASFVPLLYSIASRKAPRNSIDHLVKEYQRLVDDNEGLKAELSVATATSKKIISTFNEHQARSQVLCQLDKEQCRLKHTQVKRLKEEVLKTQNENKILKEKNNSLLEELARSKIIQSKIKTQLEKGPDSEKIAELEAKLSSEKEEYDYACNMILVELVLILITPRISLNLKSLP